MYFADNRLQFRDFTHPRIGSITRTPALGRTTPPIGDHGYVTSLKGGALLGRPDRLATEIAEKYSTMK